MPPEGEAGAANEADQRPDWLPENFKTPEDLAKSYAEAQRKITEQGQQLSTVNQNYAELAAQVEDLQAAQQQPAQQQQPSNDWLYALYDQDPIAATALLVEQGVKAGLAQSQAQMQQEPGDETWAAEVIANQAEQIMATRYPDYAEIKDEVEQVLVQHDLVSDGDISPQGIANKLELAYKIVTADKYQQALAEGQAAGQPGVDPRLQKLQAQSQQGAGSRPSSPDEDAAHWERVKAAGEQPLW